MPRSFFPFFNYNFLMVLVTVLCRGFGISLVLFAVRSLADSDPFWSSSEDGNSASTELSINEGALAFNEPILPSDPALYSSVSSDSLFENSKGTNLFLSDNSALNDDQSFELADCSSSGFPPVNGKSRVRRIDGPNKCQNSDLQLSPSSPLLSDFSDMVERLERSWVKSPAREKPKHNGLCRSFTKELLPWGACSNPDPQWTKEAIFVLTPDPWFGVLKFYYLDYCTMSKISD